MPKLSELSEKNAYVGVPKIDPTYLTLLWHSDFFDGAINGVLKYDGGKYWFEMFSESDDENLEGYYRRFFVIELSEDQLQKEEKWHQLFREKVGGHTDYGANQRTNRSRIKPQELWKEFYDLYKLRTPRDLSENQVIGWFER